MNPYLSIILSNLLEAVATILLPVLVVVLIRFIQKKTNVQLDAAKETQLHDVLMHAIGYAEEWALNKMKVTGEKPAGALKLEEALTWAKSEIERRKLDEIAKEKLQALLLAKLGLTREAVVTDPAAPAEPVAPVAPAAPAVEPVVAPVEPAKV